MKYRLYVDEVGNPDLRSYDYEKNPFPGQGPVQPSTSSSMD